MKIYSVNDPAFAPYGKVIAGYAVGSILQTLTEKTPLPEGVEYVPEDENLQALPVTKQLQNGLYGGMPIQMGWCNGHNTKLNCLEYHRDSEINLGTEDFILLLAKEEEIQNGKLDTACVKAFYVPAGVLVEVYATTLHYAPCSAKKGQGFRVLVILPRGTNLDKPDFTPLNDEDTWLRAANKWLLAHPEAAEAKQGAYIGLTGENIDIADFI